MSSAITVYGGLDCDAWSGVNGGEPGDLYAEIQIVLPTPLDDECIELIKKLDVAVYEFVDFVAMLARHEAFHPQKARPSPAADVPRAAGGN